MIKVVIIQPYNTPYRNELFNLLSDYKDIDLYVVYISSKTTNRKWDEIYISRFNEKQIKCKSYFIDFENAKDKINYLNFIKYFIHTNPDVIISQLSKYTILLNCMFFWKKIKLIHWSEETEITSHGVIWYQKRKYLQKRIELPKAFIFPGILSKEYHNLNGFKLSENIFFAPNSVDSIYQINKEEMESKFNNTSEKIKILFAGSFVERKGFDVLNKVFLKLKNDFQNLEFNLAGDGPIKPVDGMISHGFTSKEKTLNLYKDCHIFIMPSLWDCNPLSVIEAAKCGCILLLSNGVGNYPELIDGNGYIFERGSVESIVNVIEKILSKSKDELKHMGQRSIMLSSDITHRNSAVAFYNAIKHSIKK